MVLTLERELLFQEIHRRHCFYKDSHWWMERDRDLEGLQTYIISS